MLTRRHMLSTGAAALFVPAAPRLARAATKATLRLKWLPQSSFTGFYVASAKGYYRDEGLDLELLPTGPNVLTENMVATGADTFGLSGGTDSVFAARDKGMPITCFGVAHQVTPFVFVTRKDNGIRTVHDFKGKVVTAWFTGAHHVLAGILAHEGIGPDEVKIQPQQVSVTPFVNGETDVATATIYNELYAIQQRVGRDNLRTFVAEDFGITVPRDTLIVGEKTMRDQPALATAMLRASIRGWKDAFADPKGAIDILMAVAPTLDRTHQEFGLGEIKRLMLAGRGAQEGLFLIDRPAVQTAHDFFLRSKVIGKPVDLATAFDHRPAEALSAAERRV